MTDDQIVDAMRAKSARQVMAEFLLALGQLVLHHQVPGELTDLSVNFHGRQRRVDIASLTPDGQHLEAWLLGLNANVLDVEHLGMSVSLPTQQGMVQ
jgi:hypothetical protein